MRLARAVRTLVLVSGDGDLLAFRDAPPLVLTPRAVVDLLSGFDSVESRGCVIEDEIGDRLRDDEPR